MRSSFTIPSRPIESPESSRRIDAHLAKLRVTFARFIMVWSVVVNVLWWLTDAAVMGGIPGAVEAFAVMRVCVLVAAALVLALLRGQHELRGLRLAVLLGLWLGELGALAACLSVLGDLSAPWFHCLYPLILTSCTIPLALSARAIFTALMGASLLAGRALFVLDEPAENFFGFYTPLLERAGLAARWRWIPAAPLYPLAVLTEWANRLGLTGEEPPLLTRFTVTSTSRDFWFRGDHSRHLLGDYNVVRLDAARDETARWVRENLLSG